MSLRKRIFFYLVVVLICTVPVLLAGEIYFRYFSDAGYVTPEILKKRSLHYIPSMFSKAVFPQEAFVAEGWKKIQYRINSLGYRGEEFSADKPAGVIRIIIYGGSAAFDLGAEEGQDWPHQVQAMLREQGFGGVEVINAGIPNHASWDAVGRLFSEGHLFSPDIVVLYETWNDIKYFRDERALLRAYVARGVPTNPLLDYQGGLDRFLCERSQVYVRLRDKYYRYKLSLGLEGAAGPPEEVRDSIGETGPRQFRMNVASFVDVGRNAGAVPVLVTQARLVRADNTDEERERIGHGFVQLTHGALVQAYQVADGILGDVAAEKGALLIDAAAEMGKSAGAFHDHVHLTPEGSARLAAIVARELRPIVEQIAGGS